MEKAPKIFPIDYRNKFPAKTFFISLKTLLFTSTNTKDIRWCLSSVLCRFAVYNFIILENKQKFLDFSENVPFFFLLLHTIDKYKVKIKANSFDPQMNFR